MKRYLLTEQAEIDLEEIHNFISEESPVAADRLIRTIDQKCQEIVAFPQLGSARGNLGPEVRCLPVGNYLILYRISGEDIQVLRIVSGYRDILSLFKG